MRYSVHRQLRGGVWCLFIPLVLVNFPCRGDPSEGPVDGSFDVDGNSTNTQQTISPLHLYQQIFRHKRAAHQEAVHSLISMDNYAKQYKLIKTMVHNMASVLTKSQVQLMQAGFLPGSPFPEEDSTKEAFSSVAENTAFFGDILLHLPDITHDILKRNKEWETTVLWAVGFCQESQIFIDSDAKLMHLMLQELDLIEKDEDYLNPYSQSSKLKSQVESAVDDVIKSSLKTDKKRKQREKKRGPRMSRSEL